MNATNDTTDAYETLFASYLTEAEAAKKAEAEAKRREAEAEEKKNAAARKPVEDLHRNLATLLKAADHVVTTTKLNYWNTGTTTVIGTVDDVSVDVAIEEVRSASRWSSRGTGKFIAKVSVAYEHVANYPCGKNGYNVEKMAAKISEEVNSNKAKKDREAEKKSNHAKGFAEMRAVGTAFGYAFNYEWESPTWYGKTGSVELKTGDHGSLYLHVNCLSKENAAKVLACLKDLGLLGKDDRLA